MEIKQIGELVSELSALQESTSEATSHGSTMKCDHQSGIIHRRKKIETVKAPSPSIPSTSRLSRCTALHLLLTPSLHQRASPTLHRR